MLFADSLKDSKIIAPSEYKFAEGGRYMEAITMKLADLVKPEKNIRIHTEKQIKEFQRSVKMFGQIRPIVIDENNVILAGNGLYDTLVSMGKETADVYRYDNLTENQKKKLMIADNKIFSLGIENLETLNCFLEDLQGDLDIPGFDEEILKQMVSEAEDITDKLCEYGTLDDEEIQSIRENAEKKEQKMQRMEAEQSDSAGQAPIKTEAPLPQAPATDTEESTEIRKFVICPNCGEKIWL
jgi:ParB-like chromosome segregation protein Spo0J